MKLTPELVEQIRKLDAEGIPVAQIARDLGMNYGTIWRALRGYSWAEKHPGKATVEVEAHLQELAEQANESARRVLEKLATKS